MEERNQSGSHGGHLLGGTREGLRDRAVCPGEWRQEGAIHGAPGHSIGSSYQVERSECGKASGSRPLCGRLREDCQGWTDPLHSASSLDGSSGGGMDESCRRNGKTRGGRTRRSTRKERSFGAQRTGRGCSPRRKGEEAQEVIQLKVTEKEKEKEGQERARDTQRKRQRDEEHPRYEGAGSCVWEYGVGPQAFGAKEDDEASKKGGEEERKEEFVVNIQDFEFREQQYHSCGGEWYLRRGDPREDGLGQGPRGIGPWGHKPNADVVGEAIRPAMGSEPGAGTADLQSVLEDVPTWENKWANEPRDSVHLLCPGPPIAGEDSPGMRRADPEDQVVRTNGWRCRLQNLTTTGVSAVGCGIPFKQCRNFGRFTASQRRHKGQVGRKQRQLGQETKRRTRPVGLQRKRKGERRQRKDRKVPERRLAKGQREGRARWKGQGKAMRSLKVTEAAVEDQAKGRRQAEFHGEECYGRDHEPSWVPPMGFKLTASGKDGPPKGGVSRGPLVGAVRGGEIEKRLVEPLTGSPEEEKDDLPQGRSNPAFLESEESAEQFDSAAQAKLLSTRHFEGKKIGEVAPYMLRWFHKLLEDANLKHSKVKSSGGFFPLPETLQELLLLGSNFADGSPSLLLCVCSAMNSYYGVAASPTKGTSKARVAAVQAIKAYVDGVQSWEEKFGSVQWDQLLSTRSVDYRGEEVRVAKHFRWENLAPALPEQVGCIPLHDVCELGTLSYVNNFEEYLLPIEAQVYTKPPRVMVEEGWPQVCEGLLEKGLCEVMPLREVYHLRGQPVLNGLFGVSKEEFSGTWEVFRLIMNLVPINKLCRNLGGDVSTLPTWAGMSSYLLGDGQVLLMSSEDIRCFFYLFSVPQPWKKFMAFNKEVPKDLVPSAWKGQRCVLASRVLPMGFLNSVSIAQHIHRRVARMALHQEKVGLGSQNEIRRDRPLSSGSVHYRVYLDNFDVLEQVDSDLAGLLKGEPSVHALSLRGQYGILGLPRHPKKTVEQQPAAEIQGAWIDGVTGKVTPKPSKVFKYAFLGLQLLEEGRASQKQLQIICGGFVYCCMFRRALLGLLNSVWAFIMSFEGEPPVIKKVLPPVVKLEIIRFVCALPLAQMNLRLQFREDVTASDASETGGGFCVSSGLTPLGQHASTCTIRGDLPEGEDHVMVLTVGLFDGIGALRVAADGLSLPMSGHVSCEVSKEGNRVVESHFPDTTLVGNVEDIDETMVCGWACQHSNVGVVVVGGGPPCQGVSGLNVDRKGALRDARSALFPHVRRVYDHCKKHFPWAQVHYLMESVWSMDAEDRAVMSQSIGVCPVVIDSLGISLCRRPRVYWLSWELCEGSGATFWDWEGSGWYAYRWIELKADLAPENFLSPGCTLASSEGLPTFTTSRPRDSPGPRPAGLHQCESWEVERWKQDRHRYPPYQYRDKHLIRDGSGQLRLPNISEKEVIMGFPLHFTATCLPKSLQVGSKFDDIRQSLIGNTWNVSVITWLLGQLFSPLGLTPVRTVQQVVEQTSPGGQKNLRGYLQRLPIRQIRSSPESSSQTSALVLAEKLSTFVSIKGEDILLQAPTEGSIKFHRLRASVPAKLWRWRSMAGWAWRNQHSHINELELRAVLTTLSWRLERKRQTQCRFIHLVDSLVSLHCLTRGRSSSKKLRRVLSQINALVLCADVHPVWAYVSTKQNPADRPSRRFKHHAKKGR